MKLARIQCDVLTLVTVVMIVTLVALVTIVMIVTSKHGYSLGPEIARVIQFRVAERMRYKSYARDARDARYNGSTRAARSAASRLRVVRVT